MKMWRRAISAGVTRTPTTLRFAHFEQSYNAQAAVDVEGSMLVLGTHVTDAPNDKQQLVPAVANVVAVRHRLRTASGRAVYKKRKETVEPVFGIIKSVMGFRAFVNHRPGR